MKPDSRASLIAIVAEKVNQPFDLLREPLQLFGPRASVAESRDTKDISRRLLTRLNSAFEVTSGAEFSAVAQGVRPISALEPATCSGAVC